MKRQITNRWLSAAVLACLLAGPAAAEGFHPADDKRFSFSAGAVYFNVDARLGKWTEGEDPKYIDLERLGVDESDVSPYMTFDWRASTRWVLSADYFRLDVSGGRSVGFDFEYGDLVIPTPAWVSYAPQAHIIGRKVRFLPTSAENGWRLGPRDLAELCMEDPGRPRIVILNYPSNPTGATMPNHRLVPARTGQSRASRNTPAFTIVAEWR